uniref:T-cell surface glycoprotein CD3 epsilon chain n=1 Tax=Pyxicephalus adspersus TaxID=30357 RepID=A0AAV2ZLD6_PYXAD|nr:TPA: hypothetical protein GDO54_003599 [Pyxicephalus adspersus]
MKILLYFLLFWLYVDTLKKNKYTVDINGLSVKIVCPVGSNKLTKNNRELSKDGKYTNYGFSSDDNGLYQCDDTFLYLHAYVCKSCTEVSLVMVIGILIADCLVTLGVSLLVYFGCKRKPARSNEITPGGRNRGNKERPPPVPHPDYEPLQKGRQVVYDGLNKNY